MTTTVPLDNPLGVRVVNHGPGHGDGEECSCGGRCDECRQRAAAGRPAVPPTENKAAGKGGKLTGGHWATTDSGHRIYIKGGRIVAGNPHVIAKGKKGGKGGRPGAGAGGGKAASKSGGKAGKGSDWVQFPEDDRAARKRGFKDADDERRFHEAGRRQDVKEQGGAHDVLERAAAAREQKRQGQDREFFRAAAERKQARIARKITERAALQSAVKDIRAKESEPGPARGFFGRAKDRVKKLIGLNQLYDDAGNLVLVTNQDDEIVLTDRQLDLGADAAAQFLRRGHRPAPWVDDPALWSAAKAAAVPFAREGPDTHYAVVAHVYENLGGGVGGVTRNAFPPQPGQPNATSAPPGGPGGAPPGGGGAAKGPPQVSPLMKEYMEEIADQAGLTDDESQGTQGGKPMAGKKPQPPDDEEQDEVPGTDDEAAEGEGDEEQAPIPPPKVRPRFGKPPVPAPAANRDWPQGKRDRLADEDFAGPDRSFPIKTQADLDAAVHSIGRSKHSPAVIEAGIRRIAKRKGLTLPDAWQDDGDGDEPTGNANPEGHNQYTEGNRHPIGHKVLLPKGHRVGAGTLKSPTEGRVTHHDTDGNGQPIYGVGFTDRVGRQRQTWLNHAEVAKLTHNAAEHQGRHLETGQYLPTGGRVGAKQVHTAARQGAGHLSGHELAPEEDPDDDGDLHPEIGQGDRRPTTLTPEASRGKAVDAGGESVEDNRVVNSNPEGCNQHKPCGGGGGSSGDYPGKVRSAILASRRAASSAPTSRTAEKSWENHEVAIEAHDKAAKYHEEGMKDSYGPEASSHRAAMEKHLEARDLHKIAKEARPPKGPVDNRSDIKTVNRGSPEPAVLAELLSERAREGTYNAGIDPAAHARAAGLQQAAAAAHRRAAAAADDSAAAYHRGQARQHDLVAAGHRQKAGPMTTRNARPPVPGKSQARPAYPARCPDCGGAVNPTTGKCAACGAQAQKLGPAPVATPTGNTSPRWQRPGDPTVITDNFNPCHDALGLFCHTGSHAAASASRAAAAGNSKKLHAKAAEEHTKAAAHHREEGNDHVADMHAAAAKFHARAARSATHNQSAWRRPAAWATPSPETPMTRDESLAVLTANCACNEDAQVLNALSDETLERLVVTNAKATGSNADVIGSGSTQAGGEEDEEPDGDEDFMATVKARKVTGNSLTTNEWLALAPPEVREQFHEQQLALNEQKQALVTRLVANVADPRRQQEHGNELMRLPKVELLKRLELLGPARPPTGNQLAFAPPAWQPPAGGFAPDFGAAPAANYAGAGDPRGAVALNAAQDDILEYPTMNFAEEAEAMRAQANRALRRNG